MQVSVSVGVVGHGSATSADHCPTGKGWVGLGLELGLGLGLGL